MSKLKRQAKVERVMRFLVSFARPEVSLKMSLRGFDADDREEGFKLVDQAVGRNLSLKLGSTEPDKDLIAAIDAWENVWFDVADAALRRVYPEVHAQVFHNLSKTSGPLVIPNVQVFLARLAALEGQRGRGGPRAPRQARPRAQAARARGEPPRPGSDRRRWRSRGGRPR